MRVHMFSKTKRRCGSTDWRNALRIGATYEGEHGGERKRLKRLRFRIALEGAHLEV